MKKSIYFLILITLFFPAKFHHRGNDSIEMTSLLNAQENHPQMDIVLVLDNSGSMKKNDPDFLARDVVYSALQTGDSSRLGLIIFDSHSRIAVDLMSTTNISARANILASLDTMDYKGLYSDTPAAIEMAIYELKNNGRRDAHKIIILMTDGIVDTGDKQRDQERWLWLKEDLTEEGRRSGIRIFGVAFSDSADFSLIQVLAVKTDGEYFRTYKVEDIKGIFDRIMEKISGTATENASFIPQQAKSEESAVPMAMTTQPESPPAGAIQTQTQEVEAETAPVKETNAVPKPAIQWILVLTGIFVFIVIALIYFKRSGAFIKNDVDADPSQFPLPRAALIDINNISGNKTFILDKKINMIGRDPNNDVVIPKDTISSFHAVIEYKDGFFYLEDQRSINKTSLGGEELVPLSPGRLKSGDEIMFNIYRFKFILPDTIPSGKTMTHFQAPSESLASKRQDTMVQELPPLPKAILVDVKNITGKKTMHLKKRINRIGRGAGSEIEIHEDSISGLHATIEYRDGFFYLEDQRSRNKTSLWGEEMEPHVPRKLKSGDEIVFDVYKFIFLLEYELPSGDTGERTVELKN
ncbi:FHA domain-containing protein [Deltaproteobacteria bacterium]|nr:FHA domain-containing protein [Deltaproteobacteria bacterium]